MSLITLISVFCSQFSFFYYYLFILNIFRGGLRFHLINVEMNTEILLSFGNHLLKKEKPKRKLKLNNTKNKKSWL